MRNRSTWGEGRKASAPPAIPGYSKEDQDHPAHQPDPDHTKYQKGDPDAWAETPKKPPYQQGNPPSLPGYDSEDKDHPAHIAPPRVQKEARSLKAAVERKAHKCCIIARSILGKKASGQAVEDQALDMMDWSDKQINATLKRLGGGFLSSCEDEFGPMPQDMSFGGPDEMGMPSDFDDDDDMEMLFAEAKRMANQNDPNGKTLKPEISDKSAKKADDDDDGEEEVKEEAEERKTARKFFASMDTDRDGFVVKAEWKGSSDLFAALDTDGDDILAEDEVVDALAPKKEDKSAAVLNQKEAAMFESMSASYLKSAKAKKSEDEEVAEEPKKGGKKSEDEEEAPVAAKKGGKKAKKAEEEEEDDEDVETAAKKACDMAGEAGIFGGVGDPMGLASGEDDVMGEDDAMLAEIFGKSAADDEGEEEVEASKKSEDEAEEEVAASKKANIKKAHSRYLAAKKAEDEAEENGEDEEVVEEKAAAKKKAYARYLAAKKAEEDEEEGSPEEEADESPEEAEEEKAANKKAMRLASQRPQPRKPSNGVRQIGGMTRSASSNAEVNDLSTLWQSAPDVSSVFNG